MSTKFVKNERRRRVVTIVIICRCPFRGSSSTNYDSEAQFLLFEQQDKHAVQAQVQVKIRLLLCLFIYQFEMHLLFSFLFSFETESYCCATQLLFRFLNAIPPLIDIAHLTIEKAIYFFPFFQLFVCRNLITVIALGVSICLWCIQQIKLWFVHLITTTHKITAEWKTIIIRKRLILFFRMTKEESQKR